MTVASPVKPAVRRPLVKPDRTVWLVLFFVVTSILLLVSHETDVMKNLGA